MRIKDELCAGHWGDLCCIRAEMMAAVVSSARFGNGSMSIATAHKGFAERLSSMLGEIYATDISVAHGSELYTLSCNERRAYDEMVQDLEMSLGFDSVRGSLKIRRYEEECCRRAFLRGVFLDAGSVSARDKGYHLELALRRQSAAEFTARLLEEEGISSGYLKRKGYHVIYIKEGQQISDFLLVTGAHGSMLELESLMVDKSMRNSVNRVVNCDSANIDRIAITGARQQELISVLMETAGLEFLPEDLRVTAMARLENPEMSLKELGEIMDPPVGKSGMSHRLRKLEKLALETLECRHR